LIAYSSRTDGLHLRAGEVVQVRETCGSDTGTSAARHGRRGLDVSFLFLVPDEVMFRDGRLELLEAKEGCWLYHVDVALQDLWETVRECTQSLFLATRVDCND
jgi:hypothetical protein